MIELITSLFGSWELIGGIVAVVVAVLGFFGERTLLKRKVRRETLTEVELEARRRKEGHLERADKDMEKAVREADGLDDSELADLLRRRGVGRNRP